MLLILITLTVLIASTLNLWFYLGPATHLIDHFVDPPSNKVSQKSKVDVLIAARNEVKNLSQFLPAVLKQDYPKLQVIVVNDDSSDGTHELLQQISEAHPRLQVVSAFAKTTPGKKSALAKAIATSKSDWILATDADCEPASSNWAKHMLEVAHVDTEIVLGYSPYRKQDGWLNRWIRFEALYTAAQYLSAALVGRPYMGVGRNMLYSKALFKRVGGFTSHAHLAGGDDDLLVNQGATSNNTRICVDAEAWVYSQPHNTWGNYLRQKTRHLSVSTSYKKRDQVWLGLLAASHVAHFIGLIVLGFMGLWVEALLIYGLRLAAIWWRMGNIAKELGEGDLVPILPLLDIGLFIYYVRFSITALFPTSGKKTW